MNREEFMKELERLLWDIPVSERREAVRYYNDYFNDAGPENEAQVIEELGSPAQVAKTIREGMSVSGEYTERGYEDSRFQNTRNTPANFGKAPEESPKPRKDSNPWKLLAVLLLCLLLFPVIVPLFVAFLAVIAAIMIGIAGLMIGVIAAAVALPIAGIVLIGLAFYNLFFLPGVGITLGGIGCLFLSAGILLFLLAIWIIRTLFPILIRTTVSVIRYPLRKAGVVK